MSQEADPLPVLDYSFVDYASHPGYQDLEYQPAKDPTVVERAIDELDRCVRDVRESDVALSGDDIKAHFERSVDPLIGRIGDYLFSQCSLTSDGRECVIAGLASGRQRLLNEALHNNERKRYQRRGRSNGVSEQVADDLRRDGISLQLLPQSDIRRLARLTGHYREKLRQRRELCPEARCHQALPLTGGYLRLINAILRRYGFLRGASDFDAHDLELQYCALVLSHERETWWKDCYEDVGLSTSKTVYMHNDDDYELIKMMVYLDRVDEGQGPFGFIKGSHRWPRSHAQTILIKTIDNAFAQFLPQPRGTFYYRKRFKTREYRRDVVALPKCLQGTSHFGDDLVDGTKTSDQLLAREACITSDMANCMIFLGGEAIHRGGYVYQGERWALQLGLMKKPPLGRRVKRSLKRTEQAVRVRLRSLFGRDQQPSRRAA